MLNFSKVNSGENQFDEMQKHLSKVNYSKLTSLLHTVDGHWGMNFFSNLSMGYHLFLEKIGRGVEICTSLEILTRPCNQSYKRLAPKRCN